MMYLQEPLRVMRIQRQKTGAQRIPPELLKDKLFAGNEDLTVLLTPNAECCWMGDEIPIDDLADLNH